MEHKTQASPQGKLCKNGGRRNFKRNFILLTSGCIMAISGLMLQIYYHLRQHPADSTVFSLNQAQWNAMHVVASIGFLSVVVYHVWAHRKWYRSVLKRKLFAKNRPTLILTVLTLLVAVSGLAPLFFNTDSMLRFSFVEIHDKVAILFLILAFLHVLRRRNSMRSRM